MKSELRKLEHLLYGYNYQVLLRLYTAEHVHDADVATIVAAALGDKTTVRNTYIETTDQLIAEVKSSLEYRGDESSGPIPDRLNSEEFSNLRDSVIEGVRVLCRSSVSVTGLCIADGHPAYPVFWDFAYLFRGGELSTIFVGSSSD